MIFYGASLHVANWHYADLHMSLFPLIKPNRSEKVAFKLYCDY
jgi:hypothetical protein